MPRADFVQEKDEFCQTSLTDTIFTERGDWASRLSIISQPLSKRNLCKAARKAKLAANKDPSRDFQRPRTGGGCGLLFFSDHCSLGTLCFILLALPPHPPFFLHSSMSKLTIPPKSGLPESAAGFRFKALVRDPAAVLASALVIQLALASPTFADELGDALDSPSLTWTTGGNANWIAQSSVTHDGSDAAQNADIESSQESWVQTTVTGPGTLTYWWKVSSELDYDFLSFYLDGAVQTGEISGEVNWVQMTQTITAGTHTVKWRYSKDNSSSAGTDCGYLDQVDFVANGPVSTVSATSITDTTAKLNGSVNPSGLPTTVVFEYGTTIAYGNTIDAILSPNNGGSVQQISAVVGALHPSTLYHFRTVATNSSNPAPGEDATFTTSSPFQYPTTPPAIAAGQYHSLFLKSDGTVWAAGQNSSGQFGNGLTDSGLTPEKSISGVKAIAAGVYHSLFIKSDGSAWATGQNYDGQLGDGTTDSHSSPVQIMTGVQAIAAGNYFSFFLKTNGTVWAAGNNSYGQLGDGSTTQRNTPVQVMTGVQAISANFDSSLFLKTDGSVWGAGRNVAGQLGDGTTTPRSVPVQIMTGVQAISAGYVHNLFLKTDGTVWAVGSNDGRFGNGAITASLTPVQVMTGVKAISVGVDHSHFLKTDGGVWASGDNYYGQVGDGSFSRRVTSALTISGIQAISAGFAHCLYLKTDGGVWGAGWNSGTGLLGDGTYINRPEPVPLIQLSIEAVSAWQNFQFGTDDGNPLIAGPAADPDLDGIVNLLERAFNLSPHLSSTTILAADTGTSGLPRVTSVQGPGAPRLSIQYLRLKASINPGLAYTPQFASSLDGIWFPFTGIETVQSIDSDWERVTVEDPAAGEPKRFGRVKVVTVP